MKIIFNLLLLIPLLIELERAMSPVKAWELGKRFRKIKAENPDTYPNDILKSPDGDFMKMNVLGYIIILIGLLSSQWIVFLVLIAFDSICTALKVQRVILGVFINATVGALLITFAMINGLHLHYNLLSYIISMF
jgi:hypothetical protein